MSVRAVCIGSMALAVFAGPLQAGYYNSTDAPQETRFSPDYERVFRGVLSDLKNIANPQPPADTPMRRRYILIEALGHKGALDLNTLPEKLNYSAVLIRRGKADEAATLLLPLTREHPDNFVVQAQAGAAHFLASNDEFRQNAPGFISEAIRAWPERWEDVKDEQKKFLEAFGWDPTDFDRNRCYEVYFERMVRNRIREARMRRKKMPVEDAVDPIFVEDKKPVRFLNEAGKFEVGRIADAEFKKLPRDAVEAVEQLLIWIPRDDRLLWQLGEVLNASAAQFSSKKQEDARNQAIRNAQLVMQQLMTDAFNGQKIFARNLVKERSDALSEAVAKMPPPNLLDPNRVPDDVNPELTTEKSWRAITIGFVTGFLVGLFTLWQFQEMRRRRLARRR